MPSRSGESIVEIGGHLVRLLTWIPGVCFADAPQRPELLASLGRALARMDLALAGFDHPAAHRVFHWDLRQAQQARAHLPLLPDARRRLVEPIFDAWEQHRLDARSRTASSTATPTITTCWSTATASASSRCSISATWCTRATVCDLAVAIAYAMLDQQDPIAAAAQVVAAYRGTCARSPTPRSTRSIPLAAARLAMSVCYCAWQSARGARRTSTCRSATRPPGRCWSNSPRCPRVGRHEVFRAAPRRPARRAAARHLGPSLSISYREPLHIIRGWRQYLYDSGGRAYLDCVNNVAHVGHCHPRVVRAAAAQMARLNTNTRYLRRASGRVHRAPHRDSAAAAQRRVPGVQRQRGERTRAAAGARAHRPRRRRRGRDRVPRQHQRADRSSLPTSSTDPAAAAGRRTSRFCPMPGAADCDACPHAIPAAFFCESALSCAGQVILPAGYLRDVYAAIRAAGGVCVADEVQTGFGRAGSHFWMFETQGVVPDIVTLGKPIGNGHPMGAVITTPEIAASFANGMEYFNTFGGNPVSCAVGLAVLDVIRDEGLQENARVTGEYLTDGLRDLQRRHDAIRDVRGLGLFLGFDLPDERSATGAGEPDEGPRRPAQHRRPAAQRHQDQAADRLLPSRCRPAPATPRPGARGITLELFMIGRVFLVLICGGIAVAQLPPAQAPAPKSEIASREHARKADAEPAQTAHVDAVVSDAQGRPMTGLQAADFAHTGRW